MLLRCLIRGLVAWSLSAGVARAGGSAEKEATMQSAPKRVVRTARGAGRWFPGDGAELRRMVGGFIDAADVRLPAGTGTVWAVIAPHAGYVYSGKVAGYAFRALRERSRADTVVILGLCHREGFAGVALMDGDALATPLGEAAIDGDAVAFLCSKDTRIFVNYSPHSGEHSAENQVPFVQVARPAAKVVIGLLGDHSPETIAALASALGALAQRTRIAVVASTDLLHAADWDQVGKTDRVTLQQIAALQTERLAAAWSGGRQVCCGIGPVLTAMTFAQGLGVRQGDVLKYRNSGDDFPDSRGNWVVGYGAVAFVGPDNKHP